MYDIRQSLARHAARVERRFLSYLLEQLQVRHIDRALPPDLFNRFARDAVWRDPERAPAGLCVV